MNSELLAQVKGRSFTAVLLDIELGDPNSKFECGVFGEFTSVPISLPTQDGNIEFELMSIYGDRAGDNNKYVKTIIQRVKAQPNLIVGGDWNMVLTKLDTTSKSAYVSPTLSKLSKTSFFEPVQLHQLPNEHTRIGSPAWDSSSRLDYFLISRSLASSLEFEKYTTFGNKYSPLSHPRLLTYETDHKPVLLQLGYITHNTPPPDIPLGCRLWHKKHIHQFQAKMSAQFPSPGAIEATHLNVIMMMEIMHSAMVEINEQHFGSNVVQHKKKPPDLSLTYLRKASKRLSKGFFNIAKSPYLMPNPPNKVFPTGKRLAEFMEVCP